MLDKKTRDGDREIHLLTNMPKKVAAGTLADLYLKRWKLETAFADLTTILRCKVDTLAHPRAALFGFCLALLAYNVLGLVRASICAAHGEEIDETVSSFYLAREIAGTYQGMMVAVPPAEWVPFSTMTVAALAKFLKASAAHVELRKYRKHPPGPKKPPPKRTSGRDSHHVSTARVLKEAKKAKT